jgi:hypothetical protein
MRQHLVVAFLSIVLSQSVLYAKTELNSEAETLYQRAYQHLYGPCADCNLIDVKKWVERAKELGHPDAPYLLGLMYHEGLGVGKDLEKAASMFEVAARTGNAKSQTYLGIDYLEQNFERGNEATLRGDKPNSTTEMLKEQGRKNIQEAHEGLKLLAERGDTEAMCLLARTCMGMSGRTDESLAKYWRQSADKALRQAWTSKRGDEAHAAYQLSVLNDYGGDSNESTIWATKAAELGHVRAEFQVGFHYFVKDEYDKAAVWLQKAAEKQHVEAQDLLANNPKKLDKYLEKQESHSSRYWLEQAAGNGHAEAASILGSKYDYESESKNPKEAIRWYSIAARLGDVQSLSRLGDFYYMGEDVQQDYEKALKYYSEVLGHQNDDRYYSEVLWAAERLGTMYEKAEGVERDYVQAIHCYEFAARRGSVKAPYRLAEMYYKGNGVLQDYVEAYAWANIAASKDTAGFWNATILRDKIAGVMTPEQIAEGQRKAKTLSK